MTMKLHPGNEAMFMYLGMEGTFPIYRCLETEELFYTIDTRKKDIYKLRRVKNKVVIDTYTSKYNELMKRVAN